MKKKTFIKLLAFVAGLYYTLEYVLPEKIGGDFNQYEITSPSVVENLDGTREVYYVGYYRPNQSAIGITEIAEDGTLTPNRKPVLERSAWRKFDLRGPSEVRAVYQNNTVMIFYTGQSRKNEPTLALATYKKGEPRTTKRGPVLLKRDTGTGKPTIDTPKLSGYAALPGENGITVFAAGRFAVTKDGATRNINVIFKGTSTDGKTWLLDDEPLAIPDVDPAFEIKSIGVSQTDAGTMILVNQADEFICTYINTDGNIKSQKTNLPKAVNDITIANSDSGFVAWCGMSEKLEKAPTKESSLMATWFSYATSSDGINWTLSTPENPQADTNAIVAMQPGKRGTPTLLSRAFERASAGLMIISVFGLGIAIINLFLMHGHKVARVQSGTQNSAAFFVMFVAMLICVLWGRDADEGTTMRKAYDFLYFNVQYCMGVAVFSSITFYLISASYRSFRLRSVESGLMMFSAIIVMLGGVPLGVSMTSWFPESISGLRLDNIRETLLNVVNSSAYRGVFIGTMVGSLAMAIRMWLGLEETTYRGVD